MGRGRLDHTRGGHARRRDGGRGRHRHRHHGRCGIDVDLEGRGLPAGDRRRRGLRSRVRTGVALLAGADPLLLPLLRGGGQGCITATSNLRADALRTIWEKWADPTAEAEVAAAQDRINAWRGLTNTYVQLPTVKAMVAKARGNDAWLNVRPPLAPLSDAERENVWSEMDRLSA